jgi:sec-independent protein translocase protein TatA
MHQLYLQIPAGMEWIFIIIIIVVVFFGVKKIPELARTFGKAGAEYEKSKLEAKRELERLRSVEGAGRAKLEQVADSLGIKHEGKNDDELRAAIDHELKKPSGKDGSLSPGTDMV